MRCVRAGDASGDCCNHHPFISHERVYFLCSEMHYSKSLLCKSQFGTYWYNQYFTGLFVWFLDFFFLPSRGELLCVLNLPLLIAVLITPVFCGAFYFSTLRNAEIGFLNCCVINKICPNQITLSLFKIHMGYSVCMCISISIYISKDGDKGSIVI